MEWQPATSSLRRLRTQTLESIMRNFINMLWRDERGVSALEYAVLAGIVVAAVVAAGAVLGNSTTGLPGLFKTLMTTISAAI
jgi:pilus assembly protein Flp/PilA